MKPTDLYNLKRDPSIGCGVPAITRRSDHSGSGLAGVSSCRQHAAVRKGNHIHKLTAHPPTLSSRSSIFFPSVRERAKRIALILIFNCRACE